jgi:hypothetical protein
MMGHQRHGFSGVEYLSGAALSGIGRRRARWSPLRLADRDRLSRGGRIRGGGRV